MAPIDIDIDLLRALVFVYETGSFTKAAQQLFRSQSAISLKIKRLEELVGQKLLSRQPQHMELTSAGKTVYMYAIKMLNLNDELISATKIRELEPLIRFGAPDDYLQLYLADLAESFSKTGYEIEIVNDLSINLASMVDDGTLDLALFTWSPGLDAFRISTAPLSWVASPDFCHDRLDPFPLALFPKGCLVRDSAIGLLDNKNISYQVLFSSIHFAPLLAAISAGHAVGILPSNAIPAGLKDYSNYDLPPLPDVQIALKLASGARPAAHKLATTLAQSFGS